MARRWAGLDGPTVLRWLLVTCFAATIVVTRHLWQAHTTPPTVPLLDLARVPVTVPLLAALVAVLVRPVGGWICLVVVVVAAIVLDQTRIQPEIISLTILIGATLPVRGARLVGQAAVVSIWFWAGLNKALSTGWEDVASTLASDAGNAGLKVAFYWTTPALEMAAGLLLTIRRTRPVGVVLAVLLPVGVLLTLSPLGDGVSRNTAVWPWNVALAASALVLFTKRFDHRTDRLRRSPRWALAAAGVLLVVPVGWYLGIFDSYLTYQLYTGNTRTAEICAPDGTCRTNEFDTASLNVPLPPEPRIYRSIFEKTCQPGETLVLHPRLTRVLGGNPDDVTIVQCPR